MGHPNELCVPVVTDHRGLCKFSTSEDSVFLEICEQLLFLKEDAKSRDT